MFENLKKKAKKTYYAEQLCKYEGNVKKTWDIIREVIAKTKTNDNNIPKRMIIENIETFDPEKIADSFNKFFVDIGPSLASKIPNSQNNFEQYMDCKETLLEETNVDNNEMKEAFKTLKPGKSSGPSAQRVIFLCISRLIILW